MNKNFINTAKHLLFIIFIIISFAVLTSEIFEMKKALGELKRVETKYRVNVYYNMFGEYKLELLLMILSDIGLLFMLIHHVNKMCYWGYKNDKSDDEC